MTVSSATPKDFEHLPRDVQILIGKFFPAETLAKDASVSKVFKQKFVDNPVLWQQMAAKMDFKVDPKTAKEDFLFLYIAPVNNIILDALSEKTAKPLRNMGFREQRVAIEKLLKDPTLNRTDKEKLSKLAGNLAKALNPSSKDNLDSYFLFNYPPTEADKLKQTFFKLTLVCLMRNGFFPSEYIFNFDMIINHIDLPSFLKEVKTHKSYDRDGILDLALHWAIEKKNPLYMKAAMDVVPSFGLEHFSKALAEIAYTKSKKEQIEVQAAMAPLLKHAKIPPKMKEVIETALKYTLEDGPKDIEGSDQLMVQLAQEERKGALYNAMNLAVEGNKSLLLQVFHR